MTDYIIPAASRYRVTAATRHEKSASRALILSLELPAMVGVRLQGTRQTYRLDAQSVYELAVRAHERTIERTAKQIAKAEKMPLRAATRKARKQCAELLRR
jgi:hypothetical protein